MTRRVLGVAIGGSHARGEASPLADVDLFFLIDPSELSTLYHSPPTHITTAIPGDIAVSYPSIVPEFGLRYCVVSSEVGLCDLFFDTENGFPSPLRRNTRILWEVNNRFTDANQRLYQLTAESEIQARHFIRLAAQLIIEFDEAVKCILRNQPIQSWYRVSKVLNLALGVGGLAGSEGWWRHTSVADEALQQYRVRVSDNLFAVSSIAVLRDVARDLGNECLDLIIRADRVAAESRKTLESAVRRSLRLLDECVSIA